MKNSRWAFPVSSRLQPLSPTRSWRSPTQLIVRFAGRRSPLEHYQRIWKLTIPIESGASYVKSVQRLIITNTNSSSIEGKIQNSFECYHKASFFILGNIWTFDRLFAILIANRSRPKMIYQSTFALSTWSYREWLTSRSDVRFAANFFPFNRKWLSTTGKLTQEGETMGWGLTQQRIIFIALSVVASF